MINNICGKLEEVSSSKIVISCNGMSFDVFFPESNIINLPEIGANIKVFTYLNVKEDEMSLYGFLTREDKEMFLKLITVNGVGPKGALNIISKLGFSTLSKAISNDDHKLISSVQGIGDKTAKKICVELGDKIRKMSFDGKVDIIKENNVLIEKVSNIRDEVVEALVKLGYKEAKARELLNKVEIDENSKTSDILKMVLKNK